MRPPTSACPDDLRFVQPDSATRGRRGPRSLAAGAGRRRPAVRIVPGLGLLFALLWPAGLFASDPLESVLGFRPGEDGRLAEWSLVCAGLRRLTSQSPRLRLEAGGPTPGGRDFIVVVASSERNLARLDEIRRTTLRLADPRGLPAGEAASLVEEGRVVIAMTFGVHANEVAGTLSALRFARLLATSTDPAIVRALEEVVVVLVPSLDPDGHDRVVAWTRQQALTPFEGSEPPFLVHRYAGHDINRDGYAFLLDETRLLVRLVHERFRPQVVHDVHQMGAFGARMFLPPFVEPWDPNVDPALRGASAELGESVADELRAKGLSGIVTGALFDAWSPSRAYIHTHGGVRLLSETASSRLALPIDLALGELRGTAGFDPRRVSARFPTVWPGGRWRIGDAVDYQVGACQSVLEGVAASRRTWLRRFHDTLRRASVAQEPFAFVAPAPSRDRLSRAELERVLLAGGVEIARARSSFTAEGRRFAAGSLVVSMRQPFSAFARSILERQVYPGLSEGSAMPALRPYDVTAHTLPLLLGVEVVAVRTPFDVALDPVLVPQVPEGWVRGEGPFFAFAHDSGGLVMVARLLAAGLEVRWATAGLVVGKRTLPPGTFFAPARARGLLSLAATELGVEARSVAHTPAGLRLRSPRVALLRASVPSSDEGWTRFVFERQAEVRYSSLADTGLHQDLRSRFDVIVLPDGGSDDIFAGHRPGRVPPQLVGGVGSEGVAALRGFVEQGGVVIAVGGAARFAVARLGLEVDDVAFGADRGKHPIYGPGCILAARLDTSNPLAHGLPRNVAVFYQQDPVFLPRAGQTVMRYASPDPLISGGLLGKAELASRAGLVEVPLGRGKVILFGFRPVYRGQARATLPLLLNALYLSAATPVAATH